MRDSEYRVLRLLAKLHPMMSKLRYLAARLRSRDPFDSIECICAILLPWILCTISYLLFLALDFY